LLFMVLQQDVEADARPSLLRMFKWTGPVSESGKGLTNRTEEIGRHIVCDGQYPRAVVPRPLSVRRESGCRSAVTLSRKQTFLHSLISNCI
jgi:hypothetical protein